MSKQQKKVGSLWDIKRTVVEEFQIWASTKEQALANNQKEPHKITVIKETAKRSKR